MVSQCGGIYGTASVSPCRLVFHTLEFATLQAYFEESPNRGIALFALFFFGDRCRVCSLLTLVIWDVFRIHFTIHPPSSPYHLIICSKVEPFIFW